MCGTNITTTGLTLTDKNHACSCGTSEPAETESAHAAAAHIDHYLVSGMTCQHCVSSVTEELTGIAGVQFVKVALNAGDVSRIMVASDRPIGLVAVRAAVTEAGYELVESAS